MKIPIDWLKEYIDIKESPEKLSEVFTLSGTKIEFVEHIDNSAVLEAEITSNRPDCLSISGLAQELSAVTGRPLKKERGVSNARTKPLSVIARSEATKQSHRERPLHIQILDPISCPLYTARVLNNLTIKPSSPKIQKHLKCMNQKSINNIVDITNFVLFEIGQPLHAFDYDKIEGQTIIIRRAKKGEKILAINGNTYELDESILVIADAIKPIAIAGVMGGKETEVTSSTKHIVLESASFDPGLIRQAARKLKLFSDSSYRFERFIPLNKVEEGSNRATELIAEDGQAQQIQATKLLIQKGKQKKETLPKITLHKAYLDQIAANSIPFKKAQQILKNLNFKIQDASSQKITVIPTVDRPDIKADYDLIEEIIRIHGFDKIPTHVPKTNHTLESLTPSIYEQITALKNFLATQGLQEAVTLNLVSEKELRQIHLKAEDAIRIANPLSQDQEFLTPSPLLGLLKIIQFNIHHKNKNLKFFETAHSFAKKNEQNTLAIVVTGNIQETWKAIVPATFFHLKGYIENTLHFLKQENITWNTNFKDPIFKTSIQLQKNSHLGFLVQVPQEILNAFDIVDPVFYAELNLGSIFKENTKTQYFKEIPKFPSVKRDLAFIIDQAYKVEDIQKSIIQTNPQMIKTVKLFDEYKGKNIPDKKRSLAFSVELQKENATFTEDEIQALHQQIIASLTSLYSIQLR